MKKYILAGAILATTAAVFAQDGNKTPNLANTGATRQVNKIIDQQNVERIIKTLSDDNMEGRATFTPGIDRAAKFIEGEFKKIGLQPLKGESSFRQNIPPMVKTTVGKAKLVINGKEVPADKFTVSAGASFSWSDMNGVEVVKQAAGFGGRGGAGGGRQGGAGAADAVGKKRLVLIDTAGAAMFKRLKDRSTTGSISAKASPDQTVTVLGNFGDITSISVNADVKTESAPLFNVAGMLPGKGKPNEYVVFSGHYDHLGVRPGMKPDSVFNGADDDASGTTAVIELAKYYKAIGNNERTLIFVAFCAEEIGGYGARHFTTTVNPDQVVAMFNIEMIGKASKWGQNSAFITGFEKSDFGQILQRNLEGTAFKFYPDPYIKENLFYRSDNATLAALGVPAHTISTDQIDIDPDYHKVTDELKTLDVANITAAIRAIALSSRTIVSGKDTPTRVEKLQR